jgi:hypothetical protein
MKHCSIDVVELLFKFMIAVQFGCEELKYDFYKRFKDLID